MRLVIIRCMLSAAAALGAAGCGDLSLGPPRASSSPPPAASAAPQVPDLTAFAGLTYPDFVASEGVQYGPDALGLTATEATRLWRAMAAPTPGALVSGGGANALVFRGCAETGCEAGAAVVAIDTATGGAFAAVHDAGGAVIFSPNERVEALLRLNSPTRSWDGAAAAQTAATEP
jgi:hypothetical protein